MRYFVLSFLCGATLIAHVQRSVISVPVPLIQQDLKINTHLMGLVMGCWYWAYAAFQIPSGWLADRWGARRVLVVCAILWSVLMAIAGLSRGYSEFLVTWCLMGVAQACLFPCATKAIGQWFGETQRAFASGLLACSASIGIAVAPALTAQLLVRFSWQQVFGLGAIPGVVWALLYFVPTVSPPRPHTALPVVRPKGLKFHRLFTSVPMLLLCLQHFLLTAAMVFFSTWFPRFLQEAYSVNQLEAGRLTVWPGVGAIVGGLLGGYVSDRILVGTGCRRSSRQGVAMAGMSCCALFFSMAFVAEQSHWAVLLISIGAFWAGFGSVSGFVVPVEFGGIHAATTFSFMNMCGNLGGGLFPIVVAWIVKTDHHWNIVLLLIAGIFVVNTICWALFNPRGTLFEECAISD